MKTEQKDFLKKVTGMDNIPFVSAGIASDADGFLVSEDGLTKLAESAMAGDAAVEKVSNLETAATASTEKIAGLEAQVQTLTNEKTAADAKVVSLTAEVEKLGKLDAGKITTPPDPAAPKQSEEEKAAMGMDFQKELMAQAL